MSESGSGRDRRVVEYGPLLAGSWEGGVRGVAARAATVRPGRGLSLRAGGRGGRGRGRQHPPGVSLPSAVTSLPTRAGVPTVWVHSFPGAGTVLSFGLAPLGQNWGSFCGLGSRRNTE